MTGRRHGDEIVAALRRLGCIVYDEDDEHYWIARANSRMQMIRKWWFPPDVERRFVERLGHNMVDYMAAIRANRAEREAAGRDSGEEDLDPEDA